MYIINIFLKYAKSSNSVNMKITLVKQFGCLKLSPRILFRTGNYVHSCTYFAGTRVCFCTNLKIGSSVRSNIIDCYSSSNTQ